MNRNNSEKRKILVYGVGNEVKRDDAVGSVVVRRVEQNLRPDMKQKIHFLTGYFTGWNLLHLLQGYEEVVIVEGIISGKYPVGTLVEFTELPGEWEGFFTPRFLEVKEIMKEFRSKINIPDRLIAFGIEVLNISSFGYEMTGKVEKALPEVEKRLEEFLEEKYGKSEQESIAFPSFR
ncbi:MAG: hydrogenase maturation protease [bacterium JZ-2024 1]